MIVFNWTRRESTNGFSLVLVYSVETYCSVPSFTKLFYNISYLML